MEIQKRFGYEWNRYNKLDQNYKVQFWKWVYPITKKLLKNKSILDAGCGMGRNSYFSALSGAKEIIAFDHDPRTVNSAKNLLKNFKNVKVIYKDIYDISYKNKFDIIFCLGVIHHLAFPKKAIKNLKKALKSKGTLLIWIYGYKNNKWIVKYINPIRKHITSKLPPTITHKISYLCSIPLYFYLKLFRQKTDYMEQISKFKFRHVHSIVFDQLLPIISKYYKKEEAEKLLKNFKNIKIYSCNNNSWTVIGQK